MLRRGSSIDFDDMMLLGLRLVEGYGWVRKANRARYPIVVIDEYQDLGVPLHRLVLSLCFHDTEPNMNINSGNAKLVLLCPAWKNWDTAKTVKPDTVILHSRADDVIPFTDSEELVKNSGATLIEVGTDHRLADPEPLVAMLRACDGEAVQYSKRRITIMIDFHYLQAGIHGLANAHKAGTMAGHLGAAVAAGYFFGEDQSDLPDEVFRGIEGEIKRVIAGEEAIWWNAKQAGVTPADLFKPLSKEAPKPDTIKTISEAFQKNVGETRQSGHNIIFASIAIRALHDHGDFATPQVIAGITKLTEGFNSAHAGRGYYGKEKGWLNGNQVKLAADDTFRRYASIPGMVEVTIKELIATAAVKKQGFGGLWHVINHAAAITEMEALRKKADDAFLYLMA